MKSRFVQPAKPPALVLTPLLDMFTIILIFLIVSFEAESYDFKLDPEVKLPASSADAKLKPAVNVSVNKGRIMVGEKEVARLSQGEAAEAHHQAQKIPELTAALREQFERRYGPNAVWGARVGEGEEQEADEPIVVLQADRELNYRTLYLILRSAAQAGFFKYRLAIIKS